jgi:hypothetical protein
MAAMTEPKEQISEVECEHCHDKLTGYTWTVQFSFVDGVRVVPLRTVKLSCGCEFMDPDCGWDPEREIAFLYDPLRNEPITTAWIERECNEDNPFG